MFPMNSTVQESTTEVGKPPALQLQNALIRMADKIFELTEAIKQLESKKASNPSTASSLPQAVTVTASAVPAPASSSLLSFSTASSLVTNSTGGTTGEI